MARSHAPLRLRALSAAPAAALATVLVGLSLVSGLLVLAGLRPVAVIASFPAWIAAGMLWSARPRPDDEAHHGPPQVPAPATMRALVDRAAAAAAVAGPFSVRVALGGGVRATPQTGGTDVVIGIGVLALLGDGDIETLVARELTAARDCPGLEAARRRARGRIGHAHDRVTAQYGAAAKPFARLARALHGRATHVAARADLELDAAAAPALGGDRLAEALLLEAAAAVAWETFWTEEVEDVLGRGLRPPLAGELAGYLQRLEHEDPGTWEQLLAHAATVAPDRAPAAERIARLAADPAPPLPAAGERPDLEAVEAQLVCEVVGRALPATTWDLATAQCAEDDWLAEVAAERTWLCAIDLDEVPSTLRAMGPDPDAEVFTDRRAVALLSLLSLSLLRAGWSAARRPGAPFFLHRAGQVTQPFPLGWALATREATDEDFADWCAACGLDALAHPAVLFSDADGAPDPATATPMPPMVVAGGPGVPADEMLGERTLRLAQPAGSRLLNAAGLLIVGALAVPVAVVSLFAAPQMMDAPAFGIAMGLVGVVLVGIVIAVGRSTLPAIAARPTLRTDGAGGVTIEHPALLRAPLTVAREDLLLVDVDTGGSDRRFPVHDPRRPSTTGQVVGWLWRHGEPPAVPILDRTPDRPNIAIILRRAVSAPAPRGRVGHAILPGERIDGLLVQACDPEAAREVFGAAGLLRAVTVDDLSR